MSHSVGQQHFAFLMFLDASSHIFNWPCPLVGRLVGWFRIHQYREVRHDFNIKVHHLHHHSNHHHYHHHNHRRHRRYHHRCRVTCFTGQCSLWNCSRQVFLLLPWKRSIFTCGSAAWCGTTTNMLRLSFLGLANHFHDKQKEHCVSINPLCPTN